MKRWFTPKNIYRVVDHRGSRSDCWRCWPSMSLVESVVVILTAAEVAEAAAGGSRGGSGSGDGGALVWLVFEAVRSTGLPDYHYPLIGIPLDIVVIGRHRILLQAPKTRSVTAGFSSMASAHAISLNGLLTRDTHGRGFDQLKKFDPNFSEIVFTDFCYALLWQSS